MAFSLECAHPDLTWGVGGKKTREAEHPTAAVLRSCHPCRRSLRPHLADSWHGGPVFSRFDIHTMECRITRVHLTHASTERPPTQGPKPSSEEAGSQWPLTPAPPQTRRCAVQLASTLLCASVLRAVSLILSRTSGAVDIPIFTDETRVPRG